MRNNSNEEDEEEEEDSSKTSDPILIDLSSIPSNVIASILICFSSCSCIFSHYPSRKN